MSELFIHKKSLQFEIINTLNFICKDQSAIIYIYKTRAMFFFYICIKAVIHNVI